jgi:predicted ATP-grasp superfamily ATP-dependent carboligase
MTRRLTIVGASARAAAFSARAAGLEPWCADRFADVDLQAISPVERIADYPGGLRGALACAPDTPWMYTGALENHPDLVDELAAVRPLHGNRGMALRRARDPLFWSRALAEAGLASPRVSLSSDELPRDGSWLRKPLRSANGHDISTWSRETVKHAAGDPQRGPWYFQQKIAGMPIAAIFVATDGQAALLGVTRQLMGSDWRTALDALENTPGSQPTKSHAEVAGQSAFRYSGSIGPLLLDDAAYRTIKGIGEVLSRACDLAGLFGVDMILNSQNVWPVEINPRYTASVEVLERASAVRTRERRTSRLLALEWHEAACKDRQLPGSLGQSAEAAAGKLIYYAPHELCFTRSASRFAVQRNLGEPRPAVADIPAVGSTFERGEPVLTLLADGGAMDDVQKELRRAADDLEDALQE